MAESSRSAQTLSAQREQLHKRLVDTLLGRSDDPLPATQLAELMADESMLHGGTVIASQAEDHAERSCSHCGATDIPYNQIKGHREKCAKKDAVEGFVAAAGPLVQAMARAATVKCPLSSRGIGCHAKFSPHPGWLSGHMWNVHVKNTGQSGMHKCLVLTCESQHATLQELLIHMETTHSLIVVGSRSEVKTMEELIELVTRRCDLCQQFCFGRAEWQEHCAAHRAELLRSPTVTFVPELIGGATLRPGFCPFCLYDDELPAEQSAMPFDRVAKLKNHIQAMHLIPLLDTPQSKPQTCPFPDCQFGYKSAFEIGNHIVSQHEIPIFGFDTVADGRGMTLWDGVRGSLVVEAKKAKDKERRDKRKRAPEDEAEAGMDD